MGGSARGPGPRSFEALRWLDRLEVAGLEPLGLALGVSWRAAYSHVERLAAAGLAERIYDRDGSVVAITRAGREVEIEGRRVAVEVELSPKAPRRLRAILAGYDAEIASGRLAGGVLYVSDRRDVLDAVAAVARRVGLPRRAVSRPGARRPEG